MNRNNKPLTIQITDKGLKVNKSTNLSEITNLVLKGLLATYIGSCNDDNREALFAQLSLGFTNTLAYFAPDLYFPTEEEMEAEANNVAKLAATYPDNSEEIQKMKEVCKSRMEDSSFAGIDQSKISFDESGRAYFDSEEATDGTES